MGRPTVAPVRREGEEMEPQEEEKKGSENEEAIQALEGVLVEDFEPGPDDVSGADEKGLELETSQVLLMVIGPLADILAPAWGITETEKKTLAEAYAPVIDKYWPDLAVWPEVTAIAVTGIVFAPRIGKPRQEQQEGGKDGDKSKHQPTE